jgi:hypothetical protein
MAENGSKSRKPSAANSTPRNPFVFFLDRNLGKRPLLKPFARQVPRSEFMMTIFPHLPEMRNGFRKSGDKDGLFSQRMLAFVVEKLSEQP